MESLNLQMSAGGISLQTSTPEPYGRDTGILITITNEYRIHMQLVIALEPWITQMQAK